MRFRAHFEIPGPAAGTALPLASASFRSSPGSEPRARRECAARPSPTRSPKARRTDSSGLALFDRRLHRLKLRLHQRRGDAKPQSVFGEHSRFAVETDVVAIA